MTERTRSGRATASTAPLTGSVVEIRTYVLVPGSGGPFNELFWTESFPLLLDHEIQVIVAAQSLIDVDRFVLIRAYQSLKEREEKNAAFYGSPEWTGGLEGRVMSLIDSYTTVLVDGAFVGPVLDPRD